MKPVYAIIYVNEQWKLEFYKRRLCKYNDRLIGVFDDNEIFEYQYFKVVFSELDSGFDHLKELNVYGIIIEHNDEISKDMLDNELKPYIDNPFVGSMCVFNSFPD